MLNDGTENVPGTSPPPINSWYCKCYSVILHCIFLYNFAAPDHPICLIALSVVGLIPMQRNIGQGRSKFVSHT